MSAREELHAFGAAYPHIIVSHFCGDDRGSYYLMINEATSAVSRVYFDKESEEELAEKLLACARSLL